MRLPSSSAVRALQVVQRLLLGSLGDAQIPTLWLPLEAAVEEGQQEVHNQAEAAAAQRQSATG